MLFTRESRRARWSIMIAVWAFVAGLALWHTLVTREYVAMLNGLGRNGANAETPLRRIAPGAFVDSHAWVRYALACQEGAPWQVRFTDTDNAPQGREVHWNSAFVHLVSLAGRVQRMVTGEPLPRATESALAWFNLPLLLGCVIGFSAWVAARTGAAGGAFVALGMIGHRTFYDGFFPNYVDHHGLLTATAFGLVLGGLFMGAGWWRAANGGPALLPGSRAQARRAAMASALCGAIGMWISAASTIPVIAIIGFSGLAATLWLGRRTRAEGAEFDPHIWRLWGRVGAVATLAFYLIEYAPGHFSLRLEVNHPLHALAWWGGSELIALLAAWQLDRTVHRPRLVQFALPVMAMLVVPVTIVVGGEAAFKVNDPFIGKMTRLVDEGISFRAAVRANGWEYEQRYVINFVLAGAGLVLLAVARRDRLAFAFVTLIAVTFVLLSCWQVRWWLTTSGPLLCLTLAMLGMAAMRTTARTQWIATLAAAGILLPSGAINGINVLRARIESHTAEDMDLLEPVYRDVAAALRAARPNGDLVVLASPNASSGIGYYARCQTIGTLFWENTAGLKAAAEVFCADTDETARALLSARHVTHLVLVSRGSFLKEYFLLARPAAVPSDIEKTFGHRLLNSERLPRWLKIIPYRPPANIALPGLSVALLEIVPEQSEFDALWNLALAQTVYGTDAAAAGFARAIALADVAERPRLYQTAGTLAYQQHEHRIAIQLYRAGIALEANAGLVGTLAWVLATSPDASLRNGSEALALAESAFRANPQDAGAVNTLAAALAENGRFSEAANAATQVLSALRGKADPNVTALLERRAETYRAGRPWRE